MRRRMIVSALSVLALLGATVPVTEQARAHPGPPSLRFDPNEVEWGSTNEKKGTEFDAIMGAWDKAGFIMLDFEADAFDGDMEFGGVAQRNLDGRAWGIDTVMTMAEYATTYANLSRSGMRPVDREFYLHKGTWYAGLLWVKNVENYAWDSQTGLTKAQLDTFLAQERHSGRMPIDFDVVNDGGVLEYAVITVFNQENLDWRLEPDLSYAQFLAKDDQYAAEGFRTLSIDSAIDSSARFGALWWENANGRAWASRVANTDTDYANQGHELDDMGFRQIFVGRFESEDGDSHHLSAWRQNASRYNWDLRGPVDNKVQEVLEDKGLPGIQVAVMKDGQLLYSRGFGYADIDDGIQMDSTHVMRIASVTKAVGGTLALRLAEANVVSRYDWVAAWIANGKEKYPGVTLEMLMSMRACVRDYASEEEYTDPDEQAAHQATDDYLHSREWESAIEALGNYFNDNFVAGCDLDEYHYSGYSYGIGASMLEVATGKTSKQLIRDEISKPLGLKTLRVEDLDEDVHRATSYAGEDNDVADLTQMHKSHTPLGGGIESTACDLVRFGHGVIAGQVVADPEYIWSGTPYDKNAYGWALRGDLDGHRRVGKDGATLGADSYLLAFPDDDLVIAVLINRQPLDGEGVLSKTVADWIADLML